MSQLLCESGEEMIEYNDHNCERLANHIVDGMELEALLSLAVDVLLERYQKNEEAFREAIDHYYVQEEDLCNSDLI